jgi:GNAT superfamily N-acetyltransferase
MTRFEIRSIDASLSASAFDLVTEVFVQGSTIHKALKIDLSTYRSYLRPSFDLMLSEGMSLAAIEEHTGKMLGCLLASDFLAPSEGVSSDHPLAPVATLTRQLSETYLSHRNPKKKEALLVDMAAVHPDARGSGVYRALRTAIEDRAREAGWRWIVGELSSVATQRVVLKDMGHIKVAAQKFDTFEWNGDRPFLGITSPREIILAEGRL